MEVTFSLCNVQISNRKELQNQNNYKTKLYGKLVKYYREHCTMIIVYNDTRKLVCIFLNIRNYYKEHLCSTATRSPDYFLCTPGVRKIEIILSCGRNWKKGLKAKYYQHMYIPLNEISTCNNFLSYSVY